MFILVHRMGFPLLLVQQMIMTIHLWTILQATAVSPWQHRLVSRLDPHWKPNEVWFGDISDWSMRNYSMSDAFSVPWRFLVNRLLPRIFFTIFKPDKRMNISWWTKRCASAIAFIQWPISSSKTISRRSDHLEPFTFVIHTDRKSAAAADLSGSRTFLRVAKAKIFLFDCLS